MTPTQLALAKFYYRLVFDLKLKTLDEVPKIYRDLLEQYLLEKSNAIK